MPRVLRASDGFLLIVRRLPDQSWRFGVLGDNTTGERTSGYWRAKPFSGRLRTA
ncbi:hypothetical protein H6G67_07380 [Leptolyngbya sp. FACHB-239]|nr:hypothetical protein [Leptolyngbya sp. FACHB-239]